MAGLARQPRLDLRAVGVSGRLIGIVILATALLAGGAMYWLQVYAFYREVPPDELALEVTLADGSRVPIEARQMRAITADSSPIRFRACFETDGLPADAAPAPDAVPLNAPGWFGCFDAAQIGADLAAGRATAFIGHENIRYGIDRVIAVYPDGRGYAWQQINACGEQVFDGNPPPPGCPPPPERLRR